MDPFLLLFERYMYLRNAQKHLKITSYGGNESFFEYQLVHYGFYLTLLRSLL